MQKNGSKKRKYTVSGSLLTKITCGCLRWRRVWDDWKVTIPKRNLLIIPQCIEYLDYNKASICRTLNQISYQNWKLKTEEILPGYVSLNFSYDSQMARPEFGTKNRNYRSILACINALDCSWWYNDMGYIFLAQLLSHKSSQVYLYTFQQQGNSFA